MAQEDVSGGKLLAAVFWLILTGLFLAAVFLLPESTEPAAGPCQEAKEGPSATIDRQVDQRVEDLYWLTLVVALEAEGEPYEGKLAVAWVVMNRLRQGSWGGSVARVALQPREFTGLWVHRKVNRQAFESSARAAKAAYYGREPDPTGGATYYLNVTLALKQYGRLPDWYEASRVTRVIGRHTFLLAR